MVSKDKMYLKSTTDDLVLAADLYTCSEPKAVVQIIPGMSEHKERYELISMVLANCGYIVLVADNRGHGESVSKDIPLGYFAKKNGWLVNLQDVYHFTSEIKEKYRNLPFFIIGHSMGSLIGHSYLKRYEDSLSGIIFSGMPAYNSAVNSGKALAGLLCRLKGGKSISKSLVNASDYNKSITNPRTKFDWLSYNQENVDNYIEDKLCGFPFTNSGYYDLLTGMQDVFTTNDWRVLKKQLPILFVVGQDDPCADVPNGFKNSLNNLSKAGYQKVEANIYENMRHEIFNEKEMRSVYKDIVDWLNKQVNAINNRG